ncbi:MAG: hypothetical protein JWM34_1677 [Ilumatobacteraceae bacterium]|nr:hypothetical protein [Ilumatobacteraceae bacterium]
MTRLIVVTLLLAAVAIILKLRNRNNTTIRAIKVTSRVTINRGSMIAVIEVDGRRMLIGAAPNQVNLIAELADAAPLDPNDPTSPTGPQPNAAAAALSRLTGGLRTTGSRSTSTPMSTPMSTTAPRQTAPAARVTAPPAARPTAQPAAAAAERVIVPTDAESTTLVDRVRRMTTRTAEPRLRLPNQSGGLT